MVDDAAQRDLQQQFADLFSRCTIQDLVDASCPFSMVEYATSLNHQDGRPRRQCQGNNLANCRRQKEHVNMWNWHDLGVVVPHVRLQLLHFKVVDRTWTSFWQITTVALSPVRGDEVIELRQKRKKYEPKIRISRVAKTSEIRMQSFPGFSRCRRRRRRGLLPNMYWKGHMKNVRTSEMNWARETEISRKGKTVYSQRAFRRCDQFFFSLSSQDFILDVYRGRYSCLTSVTTEQHKRFTDWVATFQAKKTTPDSPSLTSDVPPPARKREEGSQALSRLRANFDPLAEIPLLRSWFELDERPENEQIARYTAQLNLARPAKRSVPLEEKSVRIWFKNARAKKSRLAQAGLQKAGSCGEFGKAREQCLPDWTKQVILQGEWICRLSGLLPTLTNSDGVLFV